MTGLCARRIRRSCFALVLLCGCLLASTREPIPIQSSNLPWQVEGTILDGVTNQPVEGVRIEIQPDGAKAVTDTQGRFMVTGNGAGNRILVGKKSRYIALRIEGRKAIGNSGIPLSLTAGQRFREIFQMYPAGTVAGRVVNSTGQSIQGANVIPLHYVYDDIGGRSPKALDASKTDDLGEFRFSNLDPGEYIFRIEPPSAMEASYLPSYYPDAVKLSNALPVQVDIGAEVHVSDIVLASSAGKTLQFRVVLKNGQATDGTFYVSLPGDNIKIRSGLFRPDGAKVVLPPGTYDLTVSARLNGAAAGTSGYQPEFVRLRVPVSMQGEGAVFDLAVPETARMTGKVSIEADANHPTRPVSGVQLRLQGPTVPFNAERSSLLLDRTVTSASDSSGILTSSVVSPGIYRVDVTGIPAGMYLAAIRDNSGGDLIKDGLTIRSGDDPEISIVLGEPSIAVRGTITGINGEKVPGAVIALVPDDRTQKHLFFQATSDANGKFEISAAPGAYHLYAWPELDGPAYLNPEFMEHDVTQGEQIRLNAESVTVDVKISNLQASAR